MHIDNPKNQTKKQRLGLYILTWGEFWDKLSYFGTLTILILYLTKFFILSDDKSYLLYGIYIAFSFATPVLGGFLADRLTGFNKAIIWGALFLIAGNLMLVIPKLPFVYLGLSLTICGTGLYKANCTSMIGNLYQPNDHHRERGFTFFYAGINVGAVLGPIVYGIILKLFGWQYTFLFSAIGVAIGLICYLAKMPQTLVPQIKTKFQSHTLINLFICFIMIIGALLITLGFYYPDIFENFLSFFGLITLLFLIIYAIKQDKLIRNRLFAILALDIFCIFFFAVTLQVGSSITLFLERHINHSVFGLNIPTMMFSSLDPLFVVLAAPFFSMLWGYLAKRKQEPSIPNKMFWGFIIAGCGLLPFALLAHFNQNLPHKTVLFLIVLGNLCLGAGEICLTPAILSAISRFIPTTLQGTMMGIWYLSLAFAGILSAFMADVLHHHRLFFSAGLHDIQLYEYTFYAIALFALLAGLLLLSLRPWIKQLLATHSDTI